MRLHVRIRALVRAAITPGKVRSLEIQSGKISIFSVINKYSSQRIRYYSRVETSVSTFILVPGSCSNM